MEFLVLDRYMENALKELERLRKVAQKMGRVLNYESDTAEPMWVTVKTNDPFALTDDDRYKNVAIERTRVFISIDGDEDLLTYGDARFVARIEATDNAAVVHTAPDYDKTIPEEYYKGVSNRCDHCGHNRKRVRYYLVEKDGELMQVGSTCVKEFIGIDPAQVMHVFEHLHTLGTFGSTDEDDLDYTTGSKIMFGHTVEEVARMAAGVVTIDKQYLKGETWNRVYDLIYPPQYSAKEYRDMVKGYSDAGILDLIRDFDYEAFVEFVHGMNPNNYTNNLKAIVNSTSIQSRQSFAVLVSGVYVYLKEQGVVGNKKAEKAPRLNEWVDAPVKHRMTLEGVQVIAAKDIETQFGVSTLYRMLDKDGRTLVWFSSNVNSDLEDAYDEGKSVNLTGTIKKHDEFNGWKQTMLTRCKVK